MSRSFRATTSTPNETRLVLSHARENNLKDVSLEIPHDEFVVVTGISGSGKSSLAFDTVYAEGQRRYIETFSPYTRQFFDKVKKPDVDSIDHVRPAIAIQQRTRITGSRSTVGSLTNINDYLKILWANLARPTCPTCHAPLIAWTTPMLADEMRDVMQQDSEQTWYLVAPYTPTERETHLQQEAQRLITLGFSRVLDSESSTVARISETELPPLDVHGDILVVLDRLKGSSDLTRVRDSIDQAYSLGSGRCLLVSTSGIRREYRNSFYCPTHFVEVRRPRPSLFSYNHPLGACDECRGFGNVLTIDVQKCIPDSSKSIRDGAIQCWSGTSSRGEMRRLLRFCEKRGIPITTPWRVLSEDARQSVLVHSSREYCGVLPWFKRLERKIYKMHVRVFLSRYRTQRTCPSCGGARLKRDALAFLIKGKMISDAWSMTIGDALSWLSELERETRSHPVVHRQLQDVFQSLLGRLSYLSRLGLSYLSLDRPARTLSGGETQRVNLASALGSELISTHFVLDEPSVGLHPRDSARLIDTIVDLTRKGNSLMVVEHDPECIYSADHVIELGPAAGKEGGEIVFQGPVKEWSGFTFPAYEDAPRSAPRSFLVVKGAKARNLKEISVRIPLNRFVCLTGVSGSGKSSLVHEVLLGIQDRVKKQESFSDLASGVSGLTLVHQILAIDQAPLAKSPRANIATYSGIWSVVRDLFAETDDARVRRLSRSSFSFNVNAGRCPACEGAGFIREDMQFLSDVFIRCDICLGKRFQAKVLEVRYKGKAIDEILDMTIADAQAFFVGHPKVENPLEVLSTLGLAHLTLGHPLSELSGGEAQRLKLVPFLGQKGNQPSLLIFDEPTTGLHLLDVQRLVTLLHSLVDLGHSVLCVEHNLSLIAQSDWVIDLGPEGGEEGGYLLFEGSPKELLEIEPTNATGAALRDYLGKAARNSAKKTSFRITKAKPTPRPKALEIRGAREHNLKNISLDIPLNRVVALTGVSGSGKSSIAKDIVYAEGQRRYLDCLSPYARQFIKELKRPEIDGISNVPPTICVYQHTFQPSRLSTVGTMSEVYNFLRLLYAKTGVQYCPDHPEERISPLSTEQIVDRLREMPSGSLRLLAPIVKLKKGLHKPVFAQAIASEIQEVRVDGHFARPSQFEDGLQKTKPHTIEFVIGKFNPKNLSREMILDAVTMGLSLGGGTLIAHGAGLDTIFSSERTCAVCARGFFKPDPEDLSFNSSRGKCRACEGTGLDGDSERVCPTCGGSRLGPLGNSLRVGGKTIYEATSLAPSPLLNFLESLEFEPRLQPLAEPILREIRNRLLALEELGLSHIELRRDCATLSGGELQRLRLATAMGSPLSGVLYIFDEPSIGLHPLDTSKVLARLRSLVERGNSIIMIEHDAESILSADYIIDVGPEGGSGGGTIVYAGDRDSFIGSSSPTAEALRDPGESISHARATPTHWLTIAQGNRHHIRDLSMKIPLHSLVTFAGVSGAGKSSLLHGIIAYTIEEGRAQGKRRWSSPRGIITSDIDIDRIVYVDQKPIGANSRSTPASYLGIWDEIRKIFAKTLEAQSRGWGPGFFSYNTGKGRCSECKGAGFIRLEMNFLADAHVECESCGGTRYGEQIRDVRYLGKMLPEVLALTFEEAKSVFANHRLLFHPLRFACELGLGYLTLGQGSSTLSGGESQRLKLVSELSAPRKGHTLYILDEPTTGLHRSDVARLVRGLRALIAPGNSVFLIEHDADVVRSSDIVVELGPGPGSNGGKVIFSGSPNELMGAGSPWGRILKPESFNFRGEEKLRRGNER